MLGWYRLPFWPIRPIFGIKAIWGILAVTSVIFSLVMLIDCLKRPTSKFYNTLTKDGEHDKLIWAAAIALSLHFYCLGAIVYFFVIKTAKPDDKE